jgi:hypothetical protein
MEEVEREQDTVMSHCSWNSVTNPRLLQHVCALVNNLKLQTLNTDDYDVSSILIDQKYKGINFCISNKNALTCQ